MKVILLNTGEVKDVSFGYAVNYLIPQGLAVRATEQEIKKLEIKKLKEKEKEHREADEATRLLSQFSGKEFIIKVKTGKNGKLHGAITRKELANKLKVVKEAIVLEKPIKKVGEYPLELKFGTERAKIKVTVEEDS